LLAAGVALHEPRHATHVDAEGEDSDSLAVRACREGAPRPEAVAALRRWAAEALGTMLR
jgi:hypothetical protein